LGPNEDFGWFDTIPDADDNEAINDEIRKAWDKTVVKVVEDSTPDFFAVPIRNLSFASSNGISNSSNQNDASKILSSWNNPNPSISMKLAYSSSDVACGYQMGINISCCVNGFRISQFPNGEVKAEYNFVFCYGSRSYSSWKQYSDFKCLSEIISTVQSKHLAAEPFNTLPVFSQSVHAWQYLEGRKKWYKCLNVRYLIEKSIYLGRFMEAVLLESPNPGLILYFVQKNKMSHN